MNLRKYAYYLASIPRLLVGIRPWHRVLAIFLGLGGPGPHLVKMRRSGLQFITRGAMDIWSLKETLIDRFYERYGARIRPGWTVIDIGGGLGDYSLLAASEQPTSRVFTFEPTPASFELLQENITLNRVRNIYAEPAAIWSQTGEISLDTTPGEAVQFISRAVDDERMPAAAANSHIRVPSLMLSDVFSRYAIDCCNMLKLDCEGAEYPILFSTPPEVLVRIERMVMEYHDNVCEHTHRDLEKFLSEQGYRVEITANPVHNYLGYLYAERPVE